MNYQNFSLIFGFLVWLVATLIFRFWGHTFFIIENPFIISVLFLATIPLLYFLIQWVFKRYRLSGESRVRSAVLMAIPGMLSDVACLKFHYFVFPTLSIEQAIVLGAWLVWAYVWVLLIGIFK